MRNGTVSVSEQTFTSAHFCAANGLSSLTSIVEYLLRSLFNIQLVINTLPIYTFNKFVLIAQNSVLTTAVISTISTKKSNQTTRFKT